MFGVQLYFVEIGDAAKKCTTGKKVEMSVNWEYMMKTFGLSAGFSFLWRSYLHCTIY
jgi:hypothetical protein